VLDLIQLPELAARMQRLGSQRAKHFSWQNTARETLEVYYEVVEQRQAAGRAVLTAPLAPR
jgi:glycosyltransferase involved in cell wall biosynthesis